MIRLIDYLFYKLYGLAQKSSVKEISVWAAAMYVGGLMTINSIVASAFLSKMNIFPFFLSRKEEAAGFCVLMMLTSTGYFFFNQRYKAIIEKYSLETPKEKAQGTVFLWIYLAASFVLIFVVAFFKSGEI